MDFFAYQVNGLRVGDKSDAHALGGRGLFIARRFRAAGVEFAAAVMERTAVASAILERLAGTIAVAGAAAAVIGLALLAAGWAFSGIRLWGVVGLLAGGTRPGGTEREAGQ